MPLNTIYENLSDNEKSIIDRAMEYATEGNYPEAIASFISDCAKIGRHSILMMTILEAYQESPESFRDG
ncbi:hypothetical protein VE03_05649 [Pseudogymnoascus sp. 23342-1-I1]|nr:hypothetical protein VE03_05649 [Pseudogymnoascus sp. 23342-1-I1]